MLSLALPPHPSKTNHSLFFRSKEGCVVQIRAQSLGLNMASLIMSFAPATTRVYAATAAKGAGGSKEEKDLLDWILGGLQKEDQLLETDPILKKVEEKSGGTANGGRKNCVSMPQKKNGGFGGLFAKK
ncbi:uncharacterized protein LOC129304201 [Prosopis cineraria]|uniref:uncharacterized protein LOC129304201 n=1 Tax=Prosopis cineraria TaxID=364024 RepID=UPI00240F8CFF|nr:uncharacterized protein LOC129304201 [Prosopis cineraria]